MNLQQLEAICAIARHRFNISAAADSLQRSQPGLSRQIKELEDQLGAAVFLRTRNKVLGLTAQGERVLAISQRILEELKTLEQLSDDGLGKDGGEIRVATSHIHARYLLPGAVAEFTRRFKSTLLTLTQCDPVQCRDIVAAGHADLGISTARAKPGDAIVTIPAFRLPRCIVVPAGHPLCTARTLTLRKLAEYPLISNPSTFVGRSILEEAFAREGLSPRIACNVTDADVCKTYVRIGMGFSVLATLAVDPEEDKGLVAIDASHLFRPGILNVVLRKHGYLSGPIESFLLVFAPHIPSDLVRRALSGSDIGATRLAEGAPIAKRNAHTATRRRGS